MELRQVQEIYDNSQKTPKYIKAGRDSAKELRALFDGENFKDLLSKIEHIEKSDEKWQARKKYARSIVDMNSRIMRPIDNVYSAVGTSKDYNVKNEASKKNILHNIARINGNNSLSSWLNQHWLKGFLHTDPAGLIFFENNGEIIWPTYKDSFSIRDYKADGQNVEWVMFEPKEKDGQKYVRFVDDVADALYLVIQGERLQEIPEDTYENILGECPGIISSNVLLTGSDIRLSPIWYIVEPEKEYLRDQSILTIVKFLNGFKNLVRPKIVCPSCHGLGKSGDQKCTDCTGTGFLVNRDVTDEIVLPVKMNSENNQIPDATKLANWIGLDRETWDKYREELKVLENILYETIWGTKEATDGNETATGRFIDHQPKINRLNEYSDLAEWVEWQASEWVIKFHDQSTSESRASINLGRNYIIESPEIIMRRYLDAKKDGAPYTILDRVLSEYITSKFKNDPERLSIENKKKNIEPYPHNTIKEVNEVFGSTEARKKTLFQEWWGNLEFADKIKDEKTLKAEFKIYINEFTNQNLNENGNSSSEQVRTA